MSHSFRQITPTDHFGWHSAYLECYRRLFAPFKELDGDGYEIPITLLEIGTDGGGGLRMYQDYFPAGNIVGVDISPTPDAAKGQPRITHLQFDAYTKQAISALELEYEMFEVIIDDGPHTLGSQEFFVQNYPSLLSEDGIAIIEDIQSIEHVPHLAALVPQGFFAMGIDLRSNNGRYDDILLVVFRK